MFDKQRNKETFDIVVFADGKTENLTKLESKLFRVLNLDFGHITTKEKVLRALYGNYTDEREWFNVRAIQKNLNKKLSRHKIVVVNVRDFGIKLIQINEIDLKLRKVKRNGKI